MSKPNFSRTVARAAASGSSKGYRAKAPIGWYAMLAVIIIGGLGLIVYSRNERISAATKHTVVGAPSGSDHWYVAYAVDICGRVEPNLAPNANLSTIGIRTFGNGIIDIDPSQATKPALFEGAKATLGTFALNYPGLVINSLELGLPNPHAINPATATTTTLPKSSAIIPRSSKPTVSSSTTTTTLPPASKPLFINGELCTSSLGLLSGHGKVQVEVWSSPTAKGHLYKGNPSDMKLKNGQMITLGFVPSGVKLPEPASKSALISDLGVTLKNGKSK